MKNEFERIKNERMKNEFIRNEEFVTLYMQACSWQNLKKDTSDQIL